MNLQGSLFNFVWFQAGWWATAFLVASGYPFWAAALLAAMAGVHLLIHRDRAGELTRLANVAFAGYSMDSLFAYQGLLQVTPPFAIGLPHFWLLGLWLLFATTVNHSLAWMFARPWLAAALGAVFGPLTYWLAGEGFGVVRFTSVDGPFYYAAGWALLMYFTAKRF